MDKVKELIRIKPGIYVSITAAYLFAVVFLKWFFHPPLDAAWFVLGGGIGIYFLDAAELFFSLTPSPFRSVVFEALFAVVAFFVVTSSTSAIGAGLVLSLFLQLLLWQIGQVRLSQNLDSWYRMVAAAVDRKTQHLILAVSVMVFLIETYFFIR